MRILFLIAFLATWSVKAEAGNYDDFNLSKISTVNVDINDSANGACWTNLKEAREYAEEKFRIKGVNLRDSGPPYSGDGSYDLEINVNAKRIYKDGTGPCMGSIEIRLATFVELNETFHLAIAAGSDVISLEIENLNKSVIERIGKFFAEMK
jgi:hypothetical protein